MKLHLYMVLVMCFTNDYSKIYAYGIPLFLFSFDLLMSILDIENFLYFLLHLIYFLSHCITIYYYYECTNSTNKDYYYLFGIFIIHSDLFSLSPGKVNIEYNWSYPFYYSSIYIHKLSMN